MAAMLPAIGVFTLADPVVVSRIVFLEIENLMDAVLGEQVEILFRAGVGGHDFQHLARRHAVQRELGFQQWHGTLQSAEIQLDIGFETHPSILATRLPGCLHRILACAFWLRFGACAAGVGFAGGKHFGAGKPWHVVNFRSGGLRFGACVAGVGFARR